MKRDCNVAKVQRRFYKYIEEKTGYYCAPVLFGCKPAELLCLSIEYVIDEAQLLQALHHILDGLGVHFRLIAQTKKSWIILVYSPEELQKIFANASSRAFLTSHGYTGASLENMEKSIDYTVERLRSYYYAPMKKAAVFPHEIGLLLGFPLSDVICFISDSNKKCMLSGYWKVYSNFEKAAATFKAFDAAREKIAVGLHEGKSLRSLASF